MKQPRITQIEFDLDRVARDMRSDVDTARAFLIASAASAEQIAALGGAISTYGTALSG